MNEAIHTLSIFEKNSGLKLNYDKSVVYRIGSIKNSKARFYTVKNLYWTNYPITVLGIKICENRDMLLSQNYEGMANEIRKLLKGWNQRNSSLLVMIVNTLIGSLFVYKMNVLSTITDELVDIYNTSIRNFFWSNSVPRVSCDILTQPKEMGGLRLVNLTCKDHTLKINWIRTYYKNDIIRALADYIWEADLSQKDITLICRPSFWRDVLIAWSKYKYQYPVNKSQIREQSLWLNSKIKNSKSPMINKRAINAGLNKSIHVWLHVHRDYIHIFANN